ncbi:GMP synthase-like glutamine amidotransferase [Methanomicrobium sp. W14]|uniref:type 1 glutamine amidotransferase n=1 Tax=Methanomicrobium sp. W14 TaxID=2817839 RepID=UPI001FD9E187|nr:type 1 glutamine amidotransferase [Methanomicrobium sp. W14]MBP2133888.1 GMP synthase-like glutamine amidotransferase [Methanomicrobium sp. W14]
MREYSKMRVHSLLHVPFEDTGCIRPYCEEKGYGYSETRLYAGEKPPSLNDFDLLVVMGGTMNIYEEERFPFLSGEKRFIKSAINLGKKVLGICLGAQLISSVLGGCVRKNEFKEIGWFDVQKCAGAEKNPFLGVIPDNFRAFHWHGDTFEIPAGCTRILESEGCKNQGFVFGGSVLALQCHPEVTAGTLKNLVENCPAEVSRTAKYVQAIPEILDESNIALANRIICDIIGCFEKI